MQNRKHVNISANRLITVCQIFPQNSNGADITIWKQKKKGSLSFRGKCGVCSLTSNTHSKRVVNSIDHRSKSVSLCLKSSSYWERNFTSEKGECLSVLWEAGKAISPTEIWCFTNGIKASFDLLWRKDALDGSRILVIDFPSIWLYFSFSFL